MEPLSLDRKTRARGPHYDVAAERASAANLNRRHDASLSEVDVTFVGCTPGLAMTAEDIRYL